MSVHVRMCVLHVFLWPHSSHIFLPAGSHSGPHVTLSQPGTGWTSPVFLPPFPPALPSLPTPQPRQPTFPSFPFLPLLSWSKAGITSQLLSRELFGKKRLINYLQPLILHTEKCCPWGPVCAAEEWGCREGLGRETVF